VKNPTRTGVYLVLGLFIPLVLSMPCAAGPGGRSDGMGAPLCAITSPANGSLVRGAVDVCGTAQNGISPLIKVQVRIDGGNWTDAVGLDNWTLTIDTALLENGEHIIYARASDASRSSEAASVEVIVRNPGPPISSGWDLMCLVTFIIAAGAIAIVILAAHERRRM
jgi:hypothetical protein